MDIEEFVKDVLAQITIAVNDNKAGGKTIYSVGSSDGVSFDLAVASAKTNTETKGVSGGMKVKVLGAEGSKTKSTEETVSQTSRVKFRVDVYTRQGDDTGQYNSGY